MKPHYSSRIALVILAILGYGTAGRVEAGPVKPPKGNHQHQQIIDQLNVILEQLNQLDEIQNQLEEIPPAWSQDIDEDRFELVLEDLAVLDKETGLVWERAPSTIPVNWHEANEQCNDSTLGNKKGWGLPTMQQIQSLVDPTGPVFDIALPDNHPFSTVQQDQVYWTATSVDMNPTEAYIVTFLQPTSNIDKFDKATSRKLFWCVRRSDHGAPDAQ